MESPLSEPTHSVLGNGGRQELGSERGRVIHQDRLGFQRFLIGEESCRSIGLTRGLLLLGRKGCVGTTPDYDSVNIQPDILKLLQAILI